MKKRDKTNTKYVVAPPSAPDSFFRTASSLAERVDAGIFRVFERLFVQLDDFKDRRLVSKPKRNTMMAEAGRVGSRSSNMGTTPLSVSPGSPRSPDAADFPMVPLSSAVSRNADASSVRNLLLSASAAEELPVTAQPTISVSSTDKTDGTPASPATEP